MEGEAPPFGEGGERVGEKRKRKHNVACLQCRKGHLKCDGVQPCANCVKRKKADECMFVTPRKRGPKSRELRAEVERLEHENERQRQLIEMYKQQTRRALATHAYDTTPTTQELDAVLGTWLQEAGGAIDGMHGAASSVPNGNGSKVPGFHISHDKIREYLELFFVSLHPFIPLLEPSTFLNCPVEDLESLAAVEPSPDNTPFAVQVRFLLAISARLSGDVDTAQVLLDGGIRLMGPLLAHANVEIARALVLLSYYFCGSGNGSDARYYNAIAYHMSTKIHHQDKNVLGKCTMTMALCEEDCNARHRLLDRLEQNPSPFVPEVIFRNFIMIAGDVALTASPSDSIALLRKLRACEQSFDSMDASQYSQPVLVTCSIFMFAVRALVYDYLGMDDVALDWANQTTRLLKYQLLPHLFFGIIPAMAIAMKIHWHTNQLQELADDIRGMFALSRSYYLAALLVKLCADNYGVDLASIGVDVVSLHQTLRNGEDLSSSTPLSFDIVDAALRLGFGASMCVLPQTPSTHSRSKKEIQQRLEFSCFAANRDFSQPQTEEEVSIASHSAALTDAIESILQEVDHEMKSTEVEEEGFGSFDFGGDDDLLPELFDLIGS